jgi:hypothetical protein
LFIGHDWYAYECKIYMDEILSTWIKKICKSVVGSALHLDEHPIMRLRMSWE